VEGIAASHGCGGIDILNPRCPDSPSNNDNSSPAWLKPPCSMARTTVLQLVYTICGNTPFLPHTKPYIYAINPRTGFISQADPLFIYIDFELERLQCRCRIYPNILLPTWFRFVAARSRLCSVQSAMAARLWSLNQLSGPRSVIAIVQPHDISRIIPSSARACINHSFAAQPRAQAIPLSHSTCLSVAYVSRKPLSYEARVASSPIVGREEREGGIKIRKGDADADLLQDSRNLDDCRPFHSHVWVVLEFFWSSMGETECCPRGVEGDRCTSKSRLSSSQVLGYTLCRLPFSQPASPLLPLKLNSISLPFLSLKTDPLEDPPVYIPRLLLLEPRFESLS